MNHKEYHFQFEEYPSLQALATEDQQLLQQARKATQLAYAPYSNFKVGAVAQMQNGEIVRGSNQENASFPAGMCAERVLLSNASSLFPNMPIKTIAISYANGNGHSDHPITPCGICRQTLAEFEDRSNQPIRLILGGLEGKVYIISSAGNLLPLSFTTSDLQ